MRPPIVLMSALALALTAACGPSADEPTSTEPASGETTTSAGADASTTQPEDTGTTSATSIPQTTDSSSDRPLAPDFTLELGDGGSYTLSDGAKPVYLVFWAEW